ncbi:hypothetical protein M8818_006660 [Zalaria obscura]|uniref:Uncharacterized protein n=1 Tax=Zalaria obscura TaxID=2024903 RepID=A0ACC3S4S7_9PEZI
MVWLQSNALDRQHSFGRRGREDEGMYLIRLIVLCQLFPPCKDAPQWQDIKVTAGVNGFPAKRAWTIWDLDFMVEFDQPITWKPHIALRPQP